MPARVLTSLAAGVVSLAMLAPFGMTLWAPWRPAPPAGCMGFLPAADPSTSLIGKLCDAAGTYTGLTINAFNLWRNPWSGLGDTLHRGDDRVIGVVLGPLSLTWEQVGTLLFVAVALLSLWQVARRDDLRGVVMAALVCRSPFLSSHPRLSATSSRRSPSARC